MSYLPQAHPLSGGAPRVLPHLELSARRLGLQGRSEVEGAEHQLMRAAFDASGGLCDSEELVRRAWAAGDQPISGLARGIVDRRIVQFEWRATFWLPLFQFQLPSLEVRCAVQSAVAELRDDLDDWGLSLWFATPHGLLRGMTPAQDAVRGGDEFVDAARADRFMRRG